MTSATKMSKSDPSFAQAHCHGRGGTVQSLTDASAVQALLEARPFARRVGKRI